MSEPPSSGARLTRQGWLTLGGGVGSLVAGRVVGLDELYVAGGVVLAAVVVAWWAVGRRAPNLEVTRTVRPARVPAGGSCRVELSLRNRSRAATPVLTLVDGVEPDTVARNRVAPLPGGATAVMRYHLPLDRRGIVTVGPLTVEHRDAFGLVLRSATWPSVFEVIVLPKVHALTPVPPAPGDEPDTGAQRHRTLATAQEEFASLRDYVAGDDVRKVHWPSTARTGRPIVRQFDQPWQRRTTVVLDTRRGTYDPDAFERAVSAAASVVALGDDRELVRLVSTCGIDTGYITSDGELQAALDLLAAVQPRGTGSLTATLRAVLGRQPGGTLVTCVGRLGDAERALLVGVAPRVGAHLVVLTGGTQLAPSPGVEVIPFDRDDALSSAWSAAMSRLPGTPMRRWA